MVLDTFGTGVWGHAVDTGSPRKFFDNTGFCNKNKCVLCQKHLSIWVPKGVRESNFLNSWDVPKQA